jgi:predicted nucleic acid-binding protein
VSGTRTVLLDANLVLLFVVGTTNKSLISRHKRTHSFTEQDFTLLCEFLNQFDQVVVTPNILTEVSNLAAQIAEPARGQLLGTLAAMTNHLTEEYVTSREASQHEGFVRLGLTDACVLRRVGTIDCVLTDDLDLYLSLSRSGQYVVNFNHIRMGALGLS